MAEKAAGKYLQALTRYSRTNVIILDDFGLGNSSHDEATALPEIIEEPYSKGIVIITSQVEPVGWKNLFQDSVISDAIVDRLINPSDSILLTGESYRKKRKPIDGTNLKQKHTNQSRRLTAPRGSNRCNSGGQADAIRAPRSSQVIFKELGIAVT